MTLFINPLIAGSAIFEGVVVAEVMGLVDDDEKPVHEVTYWPVRVSIWRNESDDGPRVNYTTVLNRLYSTGEGKKKEWHSTPSLDVEDLLSAAKALEEAFAWIHQAMAQDQQQAQAA